VTSVREAIELIIRDVAPLPVEELPLLDALGRALAEDVVSPIDLPAWTNSAMDGYAVRAEDVRGATREAPRRLRVTQEIPAGSFPTGPLERGQAARIFTGAPLPEGADGVIRQEDTDREADSVVILSDRDAGRNLRFAGEDLRCGATALTRGTSLGPAQLGVLASVAMRTVRVHRTPRVAIIASGDEIAELDEAEAILAGRKIASSNSYTLHALIQGAGAVPVPLGIARDTLASVREHFERAASQADLVLSTAGVSVGEHDFVRDALAELGASLTFWRVRMRPGAPLGFARVRGVPWIGLPGNPVSTMVCFELYVRPAIRKMQGHRTLFRRTARVVTGERVRTAGRLTHFLRAVVEESSGKYVARLTGPQGSGILTSMATANALLIVPEDRNEVAEGETLTAILLDEAWGVTEGIPV
jgi:molybdopterin molybdotransferase